MTQPTPKRILALDLGARRIGVAVSDRSGTLAQPLCVLQRKNRDADIKAVGRLVREQEAGLLVVGLPRQADDSLTEMGRRMQSFGRRLGRVLEVPVEFVDEWETTVEAQEALLAADASRRKRRQVVDKVAAGLILRRYLDGRGEGRE